MHDANTVLFIEFFEGFVRTAAAAAASRALLNESVWKLVQYAVERAVYMQEISGARQRNTSNDVIDTFILRQHIFLINASIMMTNRPSPRLKQKIFEKIFRGVEVRCGSTGESALLLLTHSQKFLRQ